MKTMTCSQMGGMCEAKITGNTSDEMMKNGMMHLESVHPDMAKNIKATPNDDPKMAQWSKKFVKDWEATPESNNTCATCKHEHKEKDGSCACGCGK